MNNSYKNNLYPKMEIHSYFKNNLITFLIPSYIWKKTQSNYPSLFI